MQAEFWLERWQHNQIGFHGSEVNPLLLRHWPQAVPDARARVLVPLCGKSLDLCWLAEQGHEVVGIELAEAAVQAFFAERGVQAQVSEEGAFKVYRQGRITLYCGDFFAMGVEQLGACAALYDRAALIALPAAMRERYAPHLVSLLPRAVDGLLITLYYQQSAMPGPPFAVGDDEVRGWGERGWQVDLLEDQDILDERFRQRGLASLRERAYRLHRS